LDANALFEISREAIAVGRNTNIIGDSAIAIAVRKNRNIEATLLIADEELLLVTDTVALGGIVVQLIQGVEAEAIRVVNGATATAVVRIDEGVIARTNSSAGIALAGALRADKVGGAEELLAFLILHGTFTAAIRGTARLTMRAAIDFSTERNEACVDFGSSDGSLHSNEPTDGACLPELRLQEAYNLECVLLSIGNEAIS